MSLPGCSVAVELLNFIFSPDIISNDGHEIYARLSVGGDLADAVGEVAVQKFNRRGAAVAVQRSARVWPPLHREAINLVVGWALGKLDQEDRVLIEWGGDAESDSTITRFELEGNTLRIYLAHPPSLGRDRLVTVN